MVDCFRNCTYCIPLGAWLYRICIGTGIGTWGLNKTVGWAWDITNFVWWVGIGHAGTLISAVLLYLDKNGEWPLIGLLKP